MKWHKYPEEKPTERQCLCAVRYAGNIFRYEVNCYAQDLYKVDSYAFGVYKGKDGFFRLDNECGWEKRDVDYWAEIEPPVGE